MLYEPIKPSPVQQTKEHSQEDRNPKRTPCEDHHHHGDGEAGSKDQQGQKNDSAKASQGFQESLKG